MQQVRDRGRDDPSPFGSGRPPHGPGRAGLPHPGLVSDGRVESYFGPGMTPLHGREPARFESPHSLPVRLVPLPSAPQLTEPETFDLAAKGSKALLIAGDSIVAEVSSDDLVEPSTLLWDGLMAATL